VKNTGRAEPYLVVYSIWFAALPAPASSLIASPCLPDPNYIHAHITERTALVHACHL
jgi:hypothetical protein